jgi:thioredoxin reductase (NADPH)
MTEIASSPMTGRPVLNLLTQKSAQERMFPTLTAAPIQRIAMRGQLRATRSGQVLIEAGAQVVPFIVVTKGKIDIVLPSGTIETLVTVHCPGQFAGEVNMLSGRPALVRARVSESGEVIELDRQNFLALVQTDSELIMRAFILRRVELIAHGLGDVVLVGANHCSGTLRVKEFLMRNGHPCAYIDLDRETDVQLLRDRFHVTPADVPVLICRGDAVLRNPTNQQFADCLGFNEPRNQPSRSVRGGCRPWRQYQTRGIRGGRGVYRDLVCAPGTARKGRCAASAPPGCC